MKKNLIQDRWRSLDSGELKALLEVRIGGPGQYSGLATGLNTVYLPVAHDRCEIAVTYRNSKIVSIEPGTSFDSAKWECVCNDAEKLLSGPNVVGREFTFSGFRVPGFWCGEHSGVQILPPPVDTPRAPVEIAEHPFILEFRFAALEFPLGNSGLWRLTNYRRIREHRKITRLLNILLAGGISLPPRRPEHCWAIVPTGANPTDVKIQWVQQSFFGRLDQFVVDHLSTPTGPPLQELHPDEYDSVVGYDGKPLRVPSDLDEMICRYLALSGPNRDKFDRATFWFDAASSHWPNSVSMSFTSLVSAIEALTERGAVHRVFCTECGRDQSHEVPGSTARFRAFFETYAPGEIQKSRRDEMYGVRSSILHGSALLLLDQDLAYASTFDPSEESERRLHNDLWSVTRIALRNWLRNPPPATTADRPSRQTRRPVTESDIAVAAYFIWLNSGRQHGHDREHWFAGGQQLEHDH